MILLVDIGNSRIKWAQLHGGKPVEIKAMIRGKTGIKRDLSKAWKGLESISQVIVANVGGSKVAEQLREWSQSNWQITPEFLIARSNGYGVRNAYSIPEDLGIDRWLGLIAVRQRYRNVDHNSAICIIDCGTAITVDVLAAGGKHLGGLIVPGLVSMSKLLVDNTAGVNEINGKMEHSLLASTTSAAVNAGALYATISFIDRINSDVAAEVKGEFKRIITGGDALRILPLLRDKYEHLPDLVLWGLAQVARNTVSKAKQTTSVDYATP
ncbi:pantothenate kinase type III CoaX-like protein [Candidatus Nitrosoglobus terrae]|uniref:Type III pantothenate kinase n=1 Tax=Candidatus Nitrosoglobus terrae TaxID=1630141 RepID=A0A1Q2SMA5_9GAMM|nr:type III pantothenate kinase [Candidatus Nitrosoglobus terrae]BAW80252.1 pantothenate kinase type III CoaX-like protein [Candidatus Nitrosoglobus terrae]